MAASLRHAAVAGRFYPGDPATLLADVKSHLAPVTEPVPALGCVAPHAGFMYSGHVAGAVYAGLAIPRRVVVMCPNHTGMGQPLSINTQGAWETPLGRVSVDTELASTLLETFSPLSDDAEAHRKEHGIEVQLPFLQARRAQLALVPIAVGTGHYESLAGLGHALAEVIAAQSEPVLIVASSDMNHYESDSITRVKDRKAIDCILALDARGLYDTVLNEDISMCGFGPTVAMITATKELGASRAELVKYATSGDISGDREMVVGYAGVIVR
ncbi:MAG TPA: AmmeMemoRadiSam system protein B [Terriglobales bacterium]|nr:AmmeMemoRadiSam system protein B [Terriglobales bacterium]